MNPTQNAAFAAHAESLPSLEIFGLVRRDARVLQPELRAAVCGEHTLNFDEFCALETKRDDFLAMVTELERRGVLADVEQYLTGLYELPRRPGYAGTKKPRKRAARDAADGVQE